MDIKQWSDGQYVPFAVYDGADDEFKIIDSTTKGWSPPLDSTITERRREHISSILFLAMSLLALIGIFLALIFLLINFRYRNHRWVIGTLMSKKYIVRLIQLEILLEKFRKFSLKRKLTTKFAHFYLKIILLDFM